ncbi:uncharacterized protein F4807DRAFT_449062 [Annulohypoxylon truncatum]|uniref:uncharacterized protein n=1 Tax=Annulohypoxylon truncatum TaxID=327061 RepID=UPI00200789AB|nr:uncharacterized protein F4807DRAFT_449062 [Annulohypoxylon truncatum]KAI1204069.1 hypothetical protein F4807DRAFT_449062 [Annulohypoxylon truncatum]
MSVFSGSANYLPQSCRSFEFGNMSVNLSGWAIRRNGSCLLTQEVDCGMTVAPFHACCPSSTECPTQYSIACCQSGNNCTEAIVESPRCANSSWIMYDNEGYFCCDPGYVGYNLNFTDGCSRSDTSIPDDALPLAQVDQGNASTTTTSESTSAPVMVVDAPHGIEPVAQIAGGVVGGVALITIILIGIFLWRRKRSRSSKDNAVQLEELSDKDAMIRTPAQLGTDPCAELSGKGLHELS